ncbi:hypothetical protein WAI453_010199 [Rhynchosporium graminicola]
MQHLLRSPLGSLRMFSDREKGEKKQITQSIIAYVTVVDEVKHVSFVDEMFSDVTTDVTVRIVRG